MDISLTTLTPIWTGDNDGVSKTLRETGLIGSLRWWYEGLMRALGAKVCDATEGGCRFEADNWGEVCAACRIFGCTGWARTFRLMGTGLLPQPWSVAVARDVFATHQSWLGRIYLRDRPTPQVLWGRPFRLHFLPRKGPEGESDLRGQLTPLLRLIEKWGALGAKTQNGHGVVRLETDLGAGAWPSLGDALRDSKDCDYFDLRRFFSAVFRVPDPGEYSTARRIGAKSAVYDNLVIPCAYDIRYKSRTEDWRTREGQSFGLRPWLKSRFGSRLTEAELASLVGSPARARQRYASRIHVSHLYRERENDSNYRLRIWGAVPVSLKVQPAEVLEAIIEFITGPKGMFSRSTVERKTSWNELAGGL